MVRLSFARSVLTMTTDYTCEIIQNLHARRQWRKRAMGAGKETAPSIVAI